MTTTVTMTSDLLLFLLLMIGCCNGFKITAEATHSQTVPTPTVEKTPENPTSSVLSITPSSHLPTSASTTTEAGGKLMTTHILASVGIKGSTSSALHIAPNATNERTEPTNTATLPVSSPRRQLEPGSSESTVLLNSSSLPSSTPTTANVRKDGEINKTPDRTTENLQPKNTSEESALLHGASAHRQDAVIKHILSERAEIRDLNANNTDTYQDVSSALQSASAQNATKPQTGNEIDTKIEKMLLKSQNNQTDNNQMGNKEITEKPVVRPEPLNPEGSLPKAEAYRAQPNKDQPAGSSDDVRIYGLTNPEVHEHPEEHHRHQVASSHEEEDAAFRCPQESGFFRHPTDCSRFYRCHEFRAVASFCAEGTAFDPETNVCSWAVGRDGCGGRLRAAGTSRRSRLRQVRDITVLEDVARDMDEDAVDKLDADNVETFEVSDYLEKLSREAGGETVRGHDAHDVKTLNYVPFRGHVQDSRKDAVKADDVISVLVVADGVASGQVGNAERQRRQAVDQRAVSEHQGRGEERTEGRVYGLTQADVDFSASNAPYQCPGDGFYADPNDCSIFYHCSNGIAYRHQCQPGTAFNQDKLVCSWPVAENGCGGMLSIPYRAPLGEQRQLQGSPDKRQARITGEGRIQSKVSADRAVSTTPRAAGWTVSRTTRPDRASQTSERAVPITSGRVLDRSTKTPERTASQLDAIQLEVTGLTRSPLTTARSENRVDHSLDVSSILLDKVSAHDFRCPDDLDGYYPDPNDCRVFYHCARGQPFRQRCGNGTAFNVESNICSWPLNDVTGCGTTLYKAGLSQLRVKAPEQKRQTDSHKSQPVYNSSANASFKNPIDQNDSVKLSEQTRLKNTSKQHHSITSGMASPEQHKSLQEDDSANPADALPQSHSVRKRQVITNVPGEAVAQNGVIEIDTALQTKKFGDDVKTAATSSTSPGAASSTTTTASPASMSTPAVAATMAPTSTSPSSGATLMKKIENEAAHDVSKSPAKLPGTSETVTTLAANYSKSFGPLNGSSSTTNTSNASNGSSAAVQTSSGNGPAGSWPWESVEKKTAKDEDKNKRIQSTTPASDSPHGLINATATTSAARDVRGPETAMAPDPPHSGLPQNRENRDGRPSLLRNNSSQPSPSDVSSSSSSALTTTTTTTTTTATAPSTAESALSTAESESKKTSSKGPENKRQEDSDPAQNASSSSWDPAKAETYRVESNSKDFKCPLPSGYFRDAQNCAVYYHCLNKVAYRQTCPNGQLFGVQQRRCLPLAEVKDCRRVEDKGGNLYPGLENLHISAAAAAADDDDDEFMEIGSDHVAPPEGVGLYDEDSDLLDGGSPVSFECELLNGFFPHQRDCAAYVECINGVPYSRQCMPGTAFDVVRQKCTWSSLVSDCKVAAAAIVEGVDASGLVDFECPSPDGYYRDPESCSNYFHCIDGRAMARKCDPNNYFDPRASVCRWDRLVADCDDNGVPIPRDRLPLSSFVCPLPNGHYRDPDDCRVFYHCLHDIPYRGTCRRHHAFDVSTMTCVPRQRVEGCRGGSGSEEAEDDHLQDEGTAPGTDTGKRLQQQQQQRVQSDGKSRGEGQPLHANKGWQSLESGDEAKQLSQEVFRCPKPFGVFRDTENCQVYHHCFSGRPFRRLCQEGTIFSDQRGLCSWPHLVPECQLVTQERADVTSALPPASHKLTKAWEAVTPSPNTVYHGDRDGAHLLQGHLLDSPESPPFASQSPPYTPESPPYAPGSPPQFLQSPPNAPEWPPYAPSPPPYAREYAQPEADRSDPQRNLDGKNDIQKAKSYASDGNSDVTKGIDVSRGAFDVSVSSETERGSHSVFQHDSRRGKVGSQQPENEAFDYDQGEVHRSQVSSDGVNHFVLEAPLPLTDMRLPDSGVEFFCPAVIFDQYFRDPRDCTRFHRCVKGWRFSFDCPRGTFFDPRYNVCDFQANVADCDHEGRRLGSGALGEPLGTPTQFPWRGAPEEGEVMSEPSPDTVPSSHLCPQTDGLFAHPVSCQKFVYCSRGTPTVLTCPSDLLYNVNTKTCDYDQNTTCVRYDK